MSLNHETKYPNRRAYVLKVSSDAKAGALCGRIENLVSGRQREFASGEELLATIASDLEASAGKPPAVGSGPPKLGAK
jgi:hypothetical protein